jgi:hypothetical protein
MRKLSSCSPRTLASSDVARVDLCDHCGIFVVHVGPVSLRLEASALESLTETLAEARRLLSERQSEHGEAASGAATLDAICGPRGRA